MSYVGRLLKTLSYSTIILLYIETFNLIHTLSIKYLVKVQFTPRGQI